MRRPWIPRLRRATQAFLLTGLSVGATLIALEVGVRLLAPQQLIDLRPDIWQAADGFGWRHRPQVDTVINTGERPARIITDARGHRIGPEPPPTDPALRVLALGDSFLEALQVDHTDTITARLERGLAGARGETVRVVNTGVGSWGPEHYRLEAKEELARAVYDAVLVFTYLPNDLVVHRVDHFPARPATEPRRLRWPRSAAKDELVDAMAYPYNDFWERRSHLYMLIRNRAKFLLMRAGLSAHYFPAILSTTGAYATVEAWQTTAEIFREIHDLAAAQQVPILTILLPGVYQVDAEAGRRYAHAIGLAATDYDLDQPQRLLARALEDAGVPYLDTLPALRAALPSGHGAGHGPLYGHVDTHLAPVGHHVVAEAVLPQLLTLLDVSGRRDVDAQAVPR